MPLPFHARTAPPLRYVFFKLETSRCILVAHDTIRTIIFLVVHIIYDSSFLRWCSLRDYNVRRMMKVKNQ